MKLNVHKVSYCKECQCPIIVCGHCGNNTCNGMSGENCKDKCSEAYDLSDTVTYPVHLRIRAWIAWKCFKIKRLIENFLEI